MILSAGSIFFSNLLRQTRHPFNLYFDVSLANEDGKTLEAHKMILLSGSLFRIIQRQTMLPVNLIFHVTLAYDDG